MNRETSYKEQVQQLYRKHQTLVARANLRAEQSGGPFERFQHPVLTADHTPPFWRYDFDERTNPHLLERLGVNSVFNVGAIEYQGKICLVARVEGIDRKSFFAVAASSNGTQDFSFWDYPIEMPPARPDETTVYDMRLTRHEDGWIYGLFCAERHDESQPDDPSAAVAACGIARTQDLQNWERLPDLKTPGGQQRNYVLHPELIDGHYALYTRPMNDFKAGNCGAGIGWALCKDISAAKIDEEVLVDACSYHNINEAKNGLGPAPIKTEQGWLHLAHGVRDTAAGFRYVLYLFLTDLKSPWKVIAKPGGYCLAPRGVERIGDVSNVVFSNGWVQRGDEVFLYYASSDTRTHVAKSTVKRLVDYCLNTPADAGQSHPCVKQRVDLIQKNLSDPWWQSLTTKPVLEKLS